MNHDKINTAGIYVSQCNPETANDMCEDAWWDVYTNKPVLKHLGCFDTEALAMKHALTLVPSKLVSDMIFVNEEETVAWYEELFEAWPEIFEQYDLTAPQVHDALCSLELGRWIDRNIPVAALESMYDVSMPYADPVWFRG